MNIYIKITSNIYLGSTMLYIYWLIDNDEMYLLKLGTKIGYFSVLIALNQFVTLQFILKLKQFKNSKKEEILQYFTLNFV